MEYLKCEVCGTEINIIENRRNMKKKTKAKKILYKALLEAEATEAQKYIPILHANGKVMGRIKDNDFTPFIKGREY